MSNKPWIVDDALWAVVEPLLPKWLLRSPGPCPVDDRRCLQGILFVLYTGIAWEFLPQQLRFGSGMTCWRRLAEWHEAGVWQCLHEVLLAELHAADNLDWSKADTEAAVETAARREIVRLERGIVVLEVIVGIAPLLGLVGTILGMMNVFGDLGQTGLNNINDAAKLAQGISLILRATLIGLLISIPSLVAWSYFSKKVEVIAVELETLCAEFVRRQYSGQNAGLTPAEDPEQTA